MAGVAAAPGLRAGALLDRRGLANEGCAAVVAADWRDVLAGETAVPCCNVVVMGVRLVETGSRLSSCFAPDKDTYPVDTKF